MTRKTTFSERTRRAFTLEDKIEALDKLQRGAGLRPLARIMEVNKSLLTRWRKSARSIRALADKRGIVTTTRHRLDGNGRKSTIRPEVEVELLQWFDIEREILKDSMSMNTVDSKLSAAALDDDRSPRHLSPAFMAVVPS
jgi:transposase-like protein